MALQINLEQHFSKDELPFMRRASDWIDTAHSQYRPVLTEFLNQREIFLLKTLVNRYNDIKMENYGGYDDAEMQRAIIYPEYFTPSSKDFQLSLISIDYPEKFASLKHSQILGTIIGSGLERSVIGDIITDGEQWQFFTSEEMVEYLITNIPRIGHTKVDLKEISFTNRLQALSNAVKANKTLPSLRLDVVIAAVFNISRSVAKQLISDGKVRLNWFTYNKPNYEFKPQDLVSVRGFGRIRFSRNNGFSKKGKHKIEFKVIKNK